MLNLFHQQKTSVCSWPICKWSLKRVRVLLYTATTVIRIIPNNWPHFRCSELRHHSTRGLDSPSTLYIYTTLLHYAYHVAAAGSALGSASATWFLTLYCGWHYSARACASTTSTPPTPSNWLLLVHPNKRSQLHCRVIVYCILCWREPITRLLFESLFNHFGYNCSGVDHFHLFQWFFNIPSNFFKCWVLVLFIAQWLHFEK